MFYILLVTLTVGIFILGFLIKDSMTAPKAPKVPKIWGPISEEGKGYGAYYICTRSDGFTARADYGACWYSETTGENLSCEDSRKLEAKTRVFKIQKAKRDNYDR